LSVGSNETLVAYVNIDPNHPPQEIMVQWKSGEWNHRAYWGANMINWGIDGTNSRRYMGSLPVAGGWARLEVAASLLGLENSSIDGLAFTMYGGRASWDRAGKAQAQAPASLRVLTTTVDESGPAATLNNSTLTAGSFGIFTFPNFGADPRTHLTIFATGITGRAANTNPFNDVLVGGALRANVAESVAVEARLPDGRVFNLPLLFAGAQGDIARLDECVFAVIPELQGAGSASLTLIINGERSNAPTIQIH
jgi:hypothetical protein